MTPQLFERAGKAMYGSHWHEPMAACLFMRVDSVKKIAKGKSQAPPNLAKEVAELLRINGNIIAAVRAEVIHAAGMVDDK